MTSFPRRRRRSAWIFALALLPTSLAAQGGEAEEAWYRAVAEHFDLPEREVRTLSEWQISPEEIPVVLALGRRAGISPEALLALRRGGDGWAELAARYGVGAGAFHVPLPADESGGPLASVYELFRDRPRGEWHAIELQDRELVDLVNLEFLVDFLGLPPGRILAAVEREGSFVGAYRSLVHSTG